MAIFRPARRLKRADLPTFGLPTIATLRMRSVVVPQASDPIKQVSNAADQREQPCCVNRIQMKRQLQHHPRNCHHLKSRGGLSPETRPEFEISIQMLEEDTTSDNDCIARDHENRKPEGKSVCPLTQAQSNNRCEQQSLVGNGI